MVPQIAANKNYFMTPPLPPTVVDLKMLQYLENMELSGT